MVIRRADATHLEAAWRVLDRCRAALRRRGIEQWDDVYPKRETIADDIAAGRLYVLIAGELLQGAIALDEDQKSEWASLPWRTSGPALVVHRLCVDPDLQRGGLGRELMDFAERHAEDNGYASIRLDAYSGNPGALAFYRQRGYDEIGEVFFPRRQLTFCCFERATKQHEHARGQPPSRPGPDR